MSAIYEIIEERFGMPKTAVIEMQRIGVLPDVIDFSDPLISAYFLFMQKFWKNKPLVQMQLAQMTYERRAELMDGIKDVNKKRWEKWIIHYFSNIYRSKGKILKEDVEKAHNLILGLFGTKTTPWVIQRVKEMRVLARRRRV